MSYVGRSIEVVSLTRCNLKNVAHALTMKTQAVFLRNQQIIYEIGTREASNAKALSLTTPTVEKSISRTRCSRPPRKCILSNLSERRPYSTDVSDCEWVRIEPLLSPLVIKKGAGRPRVVDLG